jgi:uncharacterized protein (DUF1501 family)
MAPTRRDLLSLALGSAAAGFLSPLALAAGGSAGRAPRKLVVVFADGAWDVTYALDPKLGVPTVQGPEWHEDPSNPDDREAIRTFSGIPIVVNDEKRKGVTQFFEAAAHDCVVVNGLAMGTISHDVAKIRMVTGSPDLGVPDVSVISGAVHGEALPLGSIDMGGLSHAAWLAATSGRIGYRSQIKLLVDGTAMLPPVESYESLVPWSPSAADASAVNALLRGRGARLRIGRDADVESAARFDAWDQAFQRAQRLRDGSAELLGQLDLASSPALKTSCALAVELLEADVCHSVFIATPRIWDTHSNSIVQHSAYDDLFSALTVLYADLAEASLLEETLVMVVSEFTRTPLYNASGGKDHWQNGSALLFGGGLAGGRVCGASSEIVEALPMDLETGAPVAAGEPCTYENFIAGMMELLDVDPEEWLPGVPPFRGAQSA